MGLCYHGYKGVIMVTVGFDHGNSGVTMVTGGFDHGNRGMCYRGNRVPVLPWKLMFRVENLKLKSARLKFAGQVT